MARKWYGLVVHHTAGRQTDTVDSVRAYHKKHGYADIGYHYFFQLDGKGRFHLKAGRSIEMQGCHGDAHANKYMLGCVSQATTTVINSRKINTTISSEV